MEKSRSSVLEVCHVRKCFRDFTAVDDVSFTVNGGSVTALIGPNGAGKTTLLKMITGLIPLDQGTVSSPIATRDSRIPWFSYLPEECGLYERMRVEEIILYFARLSGMPAVSARQEIPGWLERMKLTPRRRNRVIELSKGNQQKVKLICSLISRPPLLILDEPFTGLDGEGSALLRQAIRDARSAGTTLLISSHRLDQMDLLADHVVVIAAGRVALDASLAEARRLYQHNRIKVTFGTPPASLAAAPHVVEVEWDEGVALLTLAPGANAGDVLRHFLERGFDVQNFSRHAPNLNEIFSKITDASRA